MATVHDDDRPLYEVMPTLLRPGGLQALAEAALRRTLAADPHDADAQWKLAEIHRRQGNFAAARALYRRLGVHGPDRRKAAWLDAVLGGDGPPEAAPGGIWPAPFVWMTDFLDAVECDRLLALALHGRERFAYAEVGDPSSPRLDPEVRVTLEADDRTMQAFRPWFAPKIRRLVPEVLARLRMEGIDRYGVEISMRVYLTGGFYRPHPDAYNHAAAPFRHAYALLRARKLSFVYFFHREPSRFSGGDLLLYDTDTDTGVCSYDRFSRIVPLRNSIAFFPSACWHQVTPVLCETDDFGDGRWTVNGHVRRLDRKDRDPEG